MTFPSLSLSLTFFSNHLAWWKDGTARKGKENLHLHHDSLGLNLDERNYKLTYLSLDQLTQNKIENKAI